MLTPTRRQMLGALIGGAVILPAWSPAAAPPPEFDAASFRKPAAEFYPSAFWAWNDAMYPQRIRDQLEDMRSHKLLTVCVEPMPRDFRPENTGNHLDVDYLSPEYFDRYRLAMTEALRLQMKAWLYDEGGWPSGGATGRVVKSKPAFGGQALVTERRPLLLGEGAVAPPGAVAAFVENGTTLVICRIQRDNFQPDRLNPASTREFIRLTHEGYRQAMPDLVGTVMRWAFTDEPAVPTFTPGKKMPWTDALPGVFRAAKGYDLVAALPLLLTDPPLATPEAQRARIDFFDVWSQLFQDAYLAPIREWCRRYGVLSGGHFGGDDETMGSALYGYGHILRALRGLDLPGVDAIWRQIFPGQRNHHFPRYAGSVAHQQGSRRVLTESFGVYGNGLTLAEMKWIVNYQYVRGANMLVMANYPAGTSGNLIAGERPHFGPMSPLWRHQGLFQDYAARLGYVLSLGEAASRVALYLPVRDFWAAAPARTTPESQANDDVALALEKRQADFDFVDDDLLEPNSVRGGVIQAGRMSYGTLVVSRTQMLPDSTAQAMARFVRGGGALVAVDTLPRTGPTPERTFLQHLGIESPRLGVKRRVGKGSIALTTLDALALHVPPTLALQPASDALRVTERRLPAGRLLVIFNESGEWVHTTPRLGPHASAKLLDLDTGDIAAAPPTLALPPWGAVCLLEDRKASAAGPSVLPDWDQSATITGEWEIRTIDQVVIRDGDFSHRSSAADAWGPAELGDWRETVGADFSGTAEYRIRFDYVCPAGQARFLDLGEVAAAAEVWLNGESLGARAWQPYWFDTKHALRPGANELRVQVTNTLANYLTSPAVRAAWAAKKGPGWPGPYDARANAFEMQSRASGLFGPVRLAPLSSAQNGMEA